LSWALNRETRRPEDKAYCLLGIVKVFVIPNYGEGGENAWTRLIERINQDRDRTRAEGETVQKTLSKLPRVSDAAFNSQLNGSRDTCFANTRHELLQELYDWAEDTDGPHLLWLSGIAGTGKSTLARTASRRWHEQNMLGASFFFSNGHGEASSSRHLVTTIAWQLSNNVPLVRSAIFDAIRSQEDAVKSSLLDQWEHLIMEPLANTKTEDTTPTVVLVVDALDECIEERSVRGILSCLGKPQSLKSVRLKVLVTSRPSLGIRSNLNRFSGSRYRTMSLDEVPQAVVERDLRLYFQHEFEIIRDERGYSSHWPSDKDIARLVKKSCGLFIWASTACRFVRGMKAKKRLRTLLDERESTPMLSSHPESALDEIYTKVLEGPLSLMTSGAADEEAELEHIGTVLGGLVVLRSPLSIHSLAILLGIALDDVTDVLADLHAIFSIPSNSSFEPVQLHHPAFTDFLLDRRRCKRTGLTVDGTRIHALLANRCVQIMSSELRHDICQLGLPGALRSSVTRDQIDKCIPLELQYACLYWMEHCQGGHVRAQDSDEFHRFFEESFLHWFEAMYLMEKPTEMSAILRSYHASLDVSPFYRR
jgi:hypothetical protein